MEKIILHLGSNKGNRLFHLERAIDCINKSIGPTIKKSDIYITEAWGVKDQPDFLNQVIIVSSMLSPVKLIQTIEKIESIIGKEKEYHWGPRYIDIDVLFYSDKVINTRYLQVPHKEMKNRNFVLVPLSEVAAEMKHPVYNKTILELLENCEDKSFVHKFEINPETVID